MRLTTTNLKLPSPRRWFELQPPVAATICIFCLLAIGALVGRIRSAPSVLLEATPALSGAIIIIASPIADGPRPTPAPTAAAVVAALPPNALRRAVVAYDSPINGNVLGAIEQGRIYTVLARYGSEWLQADVAGSGVVWLRSADVLDLPAGLADLEPTQAPVVIERPIYVAARPGTAQEAAPTMSEPTAPTMAPQTAAVYDRQVWAMQAAGR
jgi:hypothetical protein